MASSAEYYIENLLRLTAMSCFFKSTDISEIDSITIIGFPDIRPLMMEADDLKNMMCSQPKKFIMNFVAMKASSHRTVIDLFTTMLSGNA
jgi:hypothetical protein